MRKYKRFFFVENTISNSPKVQRGKFLLSDGLFCFISIGKFGSFKNPFAIITNLPLLFFRFRRFILLVQMKKVISMNYGSSTSSWKLWRWVRLDVIFMMRDIYINSNLNPLTKFSCSRSTEFKEALSWNIYQMIMKTIPISMRIVISYAMKLGIPFLVWQKINGNWDNNMIRISTGGNASIELILALKEINPKQQNCVSHSQGLTKEVNHLSMFIWERKFITAFIMSISFTRTS